MVPHGPSSTLSQQGKAAGPRGDRTVRMLQGEGRCCVKGAEERQPEAQLHKGHPQSQNPDQSPEAESTTTSEKLDPR